MRSDGVAKFQNCVHNSVARRVETYRGIGVTHIVVDCTGNADDV